jgi:hypothetical protein
MKSLKECLTNETTINETEFCKPNDICYVVVNKEGKQCCTYLPFTGFGEGEKLKATAEKMAKWMGEGHKVVEMQFKDIKRD